MKIIILFFLVLLFLFSYVKYIEFKGVYYPLKDVIYRPDSISLDFEDVYFSSEDGIELNGWFIPNKQPHFTLLFCHGNAGNIGHRLEKIALLNSLGANIFIFDYRGFGKSKGSPSEEGFYRDTLAAYDYLVKNRKVNEAAIIVYGESLGTAMAVDLAAKRPVRALILEGAFSRGKDMARAIYPYVPSLMFSNKFDSLSKIRNVSAQLLSIHSPEDEVVPYRLARRLFDAASGPKVFAEIRGSHNDAYLVSEEKYLSCLKAFISNLRI